MVGWVGRMGAGGTRCSAVRAKPGGCVRAARFAVPPTHQQGNSAAVRNFGIRAGAGGPPVSKGGMPVPLRRPGSAWRRPPRPRPPRAARRPRAARGRGARGSGTAAASRRAASERPGLHVCVRIWGAVAMAGTRKVCGVSKRLRRDARRLNLQACARSSKRARRRPVLRVARPTGRRAPPLGARAAAPHCAARV